VFLAESLPGPAALGAAPTSIGTVDREGGSNGWISGADLAGYLMSKSLGCDCSVASKDSLGSGMENVSA